MTIKQLLKDWGFWTIIYSLAVTVALAIVSVSYIRYECPLPTLPELDAKTVEKIKTITNADTRSAIDSLFLELYGFKSN